MTVDENSGPFWRLGFRRELGVLSTAAPPEDAELDTWRSRPRWFSLFGILPVVSYRGLVAEAGCPLAFSSRRPWRVGREVGAVLTGGRAPDLSGSSWSSGTALGCNSRGASRASDSSRWFVPCEARFRWSSRVGDLRNTDIKSSQGAFTSSGDVRGGLDSCAEGAEAGKMAESEHPTIHQSFAPTSLYTAEYSTRPSKRST